MRWQPGTVNMVFLLLCLQTDEERVRESSEEGLSLSPEESYKFDGPLLPLTASARVLDTKLIDSNTRKSQGHGRSLHAFPFSALLISVADCRSPTDMQS